jgi:hypothetical protein
MSNEKEETLDKPITHRRLLLRAAYIASYIMLREDFPYTLKKKFRALKRSKWPIFIPKEDDRSADEEELVANINVWFDTNYITNIKKHIYDPEQLKEIYELMNEALIIPKDEYSQVAGWLMMETAISTEPSISAQRKKYGLT